MSTILNALLDVAAYVFGGTTTGSSPTTITFANSLLGKVCTTVVDTPILLVFVILGLVGIGVGFFKRLTR